ncbi:hypothetical protein ACTHGU_13555 [Chitinophagaceae bacterium MMS25-I14]
MQHASCTMQKNIVVREDKNVISRQHFTSAMYKMNDTTVLVQSGDFDLLKINTGTGQTEKFSFSDSLIHALRIKYGVADSAYNPGDNFPKGVIYYFSYSKNRISIQYGVSILNQKRFGNYTVNANSHLLLMVVLDDRFQLVNTILFPRQECDKFGMAVNTFSFAGCTYDDTLLLSNSSTAADSMKFIIRKYTHKDGKYHFTGYGNEVTNPGVRNERNVYMVDLCCFSRYRGNTYYTDRGAMYCLNTSERWKLIDDKGYLLYQAWRYDPANIMYLRFYRGETTNTDTTVQMMHYNNGTSEKIFPVARLKDFYAGRMEDSIYRQIVRIGDEMHYQEYKILIHE